LRALGGEGLMVAYSFKSQFGEPIVSRRKRQTIRGPRKRHARPGELLQLFTGMRTKYCVKLLDIDPICKAVTPVFIDWGVGGLPIWIDGYRLGKQEAMDFAYRDTAGDHDALMAMTLFWHAHGVDRFTGFLIEWEARA
jgi:hypothetical protein